ncbi:MAG: DUF1028 domain-containing protein [Gemmatimonadota bacterium]
MPIPLCSSATIIALTLATAVRLEAQEPVAWGDPLEFSTFSIAAVDPVTGETGVAVTTRVPCVGNAVPHVGVGVGAVATQASTRVAYGPELLALLESGVAPRDALQGLLSEDESAERRQVGVIAIDGRSAQHTGTENSAWAGDRAGQWYVTQGNILVGPGVLDSVATSFERTAESGRHLADRLIEALAAGQRAGGDRRAGRTQSAAVVVADPRPGRSRRPDGVTADINVCEHPDPIGELRRIHDTISQTLGFRTLQQFSGADVWQLKLMLHALGHFRPGDQPLERDGEADLFTAEAIDAVEAFREAEGLSTRRSGSPPGLVDEPTVRRLWEALERAGRAQSVREQIRDLTAIRR